jgi:Aspartyl/Asparaginyl beta-hydroxylase
MNKKIFDFIQLPFIFSPEKLLHDFTICQNLNWANHFNKSDYNGNWKIFALQSASGSESDITAFSNKEYFATETLKKCQYFQEIIDSFQCEKEAIRLMNLNAGSQITEHRDDAGGYADGFCRIHIPILTNEKVSFIVNKTQIPMKVGECWYANFSLPHSVSNDGETERIHLVIDCKRNSWTDELFEKLGYDFEEENKIYYDSQTKLLMIEQLSFMKTEAANNLILKLKAELEG